MSAYKIVISYDGTDYHGWQIQPDALTITGVLQNTFKYVFKKEICVIGASRTDAGVHALGQIAKFHTDIMIEPEKLLWAWSNILPGDVLIRNLEYIPDDFHPQGNVKQKTYYYHIFLQKPLPMVARYGYWHKNIFKPDVLEHCLKVFIGTHDFRSFCTGYDQENTIRTIDDIELVYLRRFNVWRIKIKGPGFLRYMIRRIVGASLDIASRPNRSVQELKDALIERNPLQNFFTAPAQGLMLQSISYFPNLDKISKIN